MALQEVEWVRARLAILIYRLPAENYFLYFTESRQVEGLKCTIPKLDVPFCAKLIYLRVFMDGGLVI